MAISLCFPGDPTEDTPYSRSILNVLIIHDAIVPEIWAFEIANNIFVSHRKRRRIDEQQISEYLTLLKELPIRVDLQPLWTNVELESFARRWDLAAYDAAYLALALRKKIEGFPYARKNFYGSPSSIIPPPFTHEPVKDATRR